MPTACNCGKPIHDNAHLCRACTRDLASLLRGLPWLLRQLEVTASKQARMGTVGAGHGDPGLPLHLGAVEAARTIRELLRDRSPKQMADSVHTLRMRDWAPGFLDDLTAAVEHGTRTIDRPPPLRIECTCGNRVPLEPDEIARCGDCGQWGTVQWWVDNHAPAPTGPLPIPDLVVHLAEHHRLRVTANEIRNWADTGRLRPVVTGDLPHGGGRGVRLFDPATVAVFAAQRRMPRAS